MTQRLKIIKLLLKADAKSPENQRTINVSFSGVTPLDCAVKNRNDPGYDRIIEVLIAAGSQTGDQLEGNNCIFAKPTAELGIIQNRYWLALFIHIKYFPQD